MGHNHLMDLMGDGALNAVFTADERAQFDAFLATYRTLLNQSLDGLTEDEARLRLLPSKTTLLGLVKHSACVEQIWFLEAVSGIPRSEFGVPALMDETYDLTEADTIASVRAEHQRACDASTQIAAGRSLGDIANGHRFGDVSLRWIYLHMLRELAQHVGHAEIVRELVLTQRELT